MINERSKVLFLVSEDVPPAMGKSKGVGKKLRLPEKLLFPESVYVPPALPSGKASFPWERGRPARI